MKMLENWRDHRVADPSLRKRLAKILASIEKAGGVR